MNDRFQSRSESPSQADFFDVNVSKLCLALFMLVASSATAQMYRCDNNVMTDRPENHSGCTNMKTQETFESESEKASADSPVEMGEAIARSDDGQWYSGGTLHKANVAAWRLGTEDNQLATASDFAAVALEGQFTSMMQLKRRAVDLRVCITEAVAEVPIDSTPVSEIAAMCVVLMEWKVD